MASDSDTAEIVLITAHDLRWLAFALRNVQTRTVLETVARQAMYVAFDLLLEKEPKQPEYVVAFSLDQAFLALWAANEGRCRDCEEWLTRGRMQRKFHELTGTQGVNGL